jgi:primase-polymerase (primpol)-like protein
VRGRSKNQDLIDELARWLDAPDQEKVQTNGHPKAAPNSEFAGPTDEQIVEKCRAAENAAKFSDLFDRGDTRAHHDGDASRADLALASMLAFWTQDEAQLERICSSSALGQREKWRRRDDYRKRTIRKALAEVGEVYDWGRQRARPLFSSFHSPLGGPVMMKTTRSLKSCGLPSSASPRSAST